MQPKAIGTRRQINIIMPHKSGRLGRVDVDVWAESVGRDVIADKAHQPMSVAVLVCWLVYLSWRLRVAIADQFTLPCVIIASVLLADIAAVCAMLRAAAGLADNAQIVYAAICVAICGGLVGTWRLGDGVRRSKGLPSAFGQDAKHRLAVVVQQARLPVVMAGDERGKLADVAMRGDKGAMIHRVC